MSHTGHPLLGDPVYAKSKTRFEERHPKLFNGQALHAARLTFTHPESGERVSFNAPLPDNFTEALRILESECE
jgi:23S rRNA pseudouridine1911/1915/1917 synthase